LLEAKVRAERWRQAYNTVRPHDALGYKPPAPDHFLAANVNSRHRAVLKTSGSSYFPSAVDIERPVAGHTPLPALHG